MLMSVQSCRIQVVNDYADTPLRSQRLRWYQVRVINDYADTVHVFSESLRQKKSLQTRFSLLIWGPNKG